MDNVTHSLIGIAIGRGVLASRRAQALSERARRAIVWTAVIASSAPDVDIFLPPYGKLGRIVHHRGFTHTLAALPLAALIAALIGWMIAGRDRSAVKRLGWAAGLGVFFHLVADSWNDYGVHPFWPVINRWYHGDFIFIIEPLIWMTLIPLAVATSRSRALQGVLGFFAAAMLALVWITPYAPALVASWVTLWLVVSAVGQWRLRSLPLALGQMAAVLATFALASNSVRSDVAAVLGRNDPQERLHDLVRSPAPGNPFCWRFVAVSTRAVDQEGAYRVRLGTMSLLPRFFDPASCMARAYGPRTAPLTPVEIPARSEIAWQGEFEGSVEELRRLAHENCQFARLLLFARAPYWKSEASGRKIVGDLRYDFEPGLGFSELELSGDAGCEIAAPWTMPIQELLD